MGLFSRSTEAKQTVARPVMNSGRTKNGAHGDEILARLRKAVDQARGAVGKTKLTVSTELVDLNGPTRIFTVKNGSTVMAQVHVNLRSQPHQLHCKVEDARLSPHVENEMGELARTLSYELVGAEPVPA